MFNKAAVETVGLCLRVLGMKAVAVLAGLLAASTWTAAAAAGYPERIVSLAPNLTEILYDIGVDDRVVAVTDYCDHPPEAVRKPKIGGFVNPSLEAIVSQRPDCVVMTEDGNPRALDLRLRELGIRTHVFRARRIQDLPREIRAMGVALGARVVAEQRAAWIETRIRRIAESVRTGSRGAVRKAIFVFQPAPLIAAGKGTTVDDAFAILGIENIASTGPTRYPKYSLEEIIRLQPDAFFFGKGRGMEERIKSLTERLSSLDAVREGRIYFIGDAVFRLGPRIAYGLEEMAACLQSP